MKVCNYCGTEMNDDTRRCPFCGSDMSLRGAVKNKNSKTSAELRFEEMNSDAFASNIVEKIKNSVAESKNNKKNAAYAHDAKAAKDAERKVREIKQIKKTKTFSNNKQQKGMSRIGIAIFVIFLSMVVPGIIESIESFDSPYDFYESYIGEDDFSTGYYDEEENFYENSSMRILYYVPEGFEDNCYVDEDVNKTYINEFSMDNEDFTSSLSITYVNKEYADWAMDADEYLSDAKDTYTDEENGFKFVEDVKYTLGNFDYIGFTYTDTVEDSFEGKEVGRYNMYLVTDNTSYYYTIVRLDARSYEELNKMLEGFKDIDIK